MAARPLGSGFFVRGTGHFIINSKELVKQAQNLPSRIVELFAEEIGVEWVDINALMELQSIIIEEIVGQEIEASNIFTAFKMIQETVSRRWTNWLQESVSSAYDV
jgi:hypothetical protein